MIKEVIIRLDSDDKVVLAKANEIIDTIVFELYGTCNNICTVDSRNTDYNGDEWGKIYLEEIVGVLKSLSESDILSLGAK